MRMFLYLLAFVAISAPAAEEACEQALIFKPRAGTLEYYVNQTRRNERHQKLTPDFVNPKEEVELAKKWKGLSGPALFQGMLPKDCFFIDHKLLGSAGDGIVKDAGSGEFVMLRCFITWHNQEVGFNISVPVKALIANVNRQEKWLIGPEMEMALDWTHGGGTKTTGNHTTIGLMNHMIKYNLGVIGSDAPLHGEGPRIFYRDDEDYLDYREAILNKFVDPRVPVIGLGHSMGGIFADLMMRRSDRRRPSRYVGFVALSGVVDLLPGRSFAEKNQAELWKTAEQKQAHLQHRIAPGDRALGNQLAQDDKISALSGLFPTFMNMFHDWTEPPHKGAEYLPTLAVWGDSDYLYVGNEAIIDSHLLNLKNVTLKIFGPRVNFKGDVVQVGHLIFDHYRTVKDHSEAIKTVYDYLAAKGVVISSEDIEGARQQFFERFVRPHVSQHYWMNEDNRGFEALFTAAYYWDKDFREFAKQAMKTTDVFRKALGDAQKKMGGKPDPLGFAIRDAERAYLLQFIHKDLPETYTLVREFAEKLLGKKLESNIRDGNTAMLGNLLQAYSANLAFREYVNSLDVLVETTTVAFKAFNDKIDKLREYSKLTDSLRKTTHAINQIKPGREVPYNLKVIAESAPKQIAVVVLALEALGIPADQITAESEKITQIQKKTWVPAGPKSEETKANVSRRETLQKEIIELQKEKTGLRVQLDSVVAKRAKLENDLKDFSEKTGNVEIDRAVKAADEALTSLLENDEKVRIAVEKFMIEAKEKKLFNVNLLSQFPEEVQKVFDAYQKSSIAYQAAAQKVREITVQAAVLGRLGPLASETVKELNAARSEHQRLGQEVNKLDGSVYVKQQLVNNLLINYTNELVPGFVHLEKRKLVEMLAIRSQDWGTIRGHLEEAWGSWKSLWRERPAPEKVELY